MADSIARDYSSYAPITIKASKIKSTFTDFVFKVTEDHLPDEFLDADGTYAPLASGADIRFFDSNTNLLTPIAFDIINISLDNTPANSKVEIHVRVPSVSSSVDTVIHVAWGMPREVPLWTGHPQGKDATYQSADNRREAIYTMESTGTDLPDRTDNSNDGTKQSSGDPIHSTSSGNFFDGQEFTGDGTSYIDLPDIDMGNNFYIQFALKTDVTSPVGDERIISKKENWTDTDGWEITRANGSDTNMVVIGSGSTLGVVNNITSSIGDGNWHIYGFNFIGGTCEVYVDGQWKTNVTIDSVVNNNHTICVGNDSDHNEADYDGFMDDLIIMDVCNETERLAMERNQYDPADFATKGSRVAIVDTPVTVVIDNVQRGSFTMSGTSQGQAVTAVDLSKSILFTSVRVDGADVPGADDVHCDIYMSSATNIQAERYGSSGTVTIDWQLVEFSAGVTVERANNIAMGSAVTQVYDEFTNPFNRYRSFILMNYAVNQTAFDSDGRLSVEFERSDDCFIQRATSGGVACTFSIQVVQYDGCFVQWLNDINSDAASSFTDDVDDNVVVAKTALIGSLRDSGSNTNDGDQIINMELTDVNTITFRKYSAVAHGIYYRVFVIEFTDETIVQQYLNTLESGDTESQIVSPSVDSDISIAIHQALEPSLVSSEDTAEDGDEFAFTADLTSGSNISMIRGSNSSIEAKLSVAVISFGPLPDTGLLEREYPRGVNRGILRGVF